LQIILVNQVERFINKLTQPEVITVAKTPRKIPGKL
jgi:hypothetical protein